MTQAQKISKKEEKKKRIVAAKNFIEYLKNRVKEIEDLLDNDKTLSSEERDIYKAQIKYYKGYIFMGKISPRMAKNFFGTCSIMGGPNEYRYAAAIRRVREMREVESQVMRDLIHQKEGAYGIDELPSTIEIDGEMFSVDELINGYSIQEELPVDSKKPSEWGDGE